jgi:hypothetical protein
VAEIVREADGFHEVLVQGQRAGDRTRDLRDLERMREARPVEVALVVHENLRLVDEAAKRGGVNDTIAVSLKLAAQRGRRFPVPAAA